MAEWSQSHFLQSLGWATLNSLWQMGLLWALYLTLNNFKNFTPARKFQISALSLIIGFGWFILSFINYYQDNTFTALNFFDQNISERNNFLQILLLSASVAYLALLLIPSWKLFRSFRFVNKIKNERIVKADLDLRLFVQKISERMGIKKKIVLRLSALTRTPLTIGSFKPVILLPFAIMNHLSIQQVEAILLHELSHIRRQDYLVNFILNLIFTFLYFNPFVKQFMNVIEEERENCCDELVLQFGYDKIGYASALLNLEKAASRHVLVLGAAGKNHLLHRIEKITGMKKKKTFSLRQFRGIIAGLFSIILFNSVLIIKEEKKTVPLSASIAYSDVTSPLHLFDAENNTAANNSRHSTLEKISFKSKPANYRIDYKITSPVPGEKPVVVHTVTPAYEKVAYDVIDGSLNTDQKNKIKSTVDATKKLVGNLQWKELENSIADAMTYEEKTAAKNEYLDEVNKEVNWKNIEENFKAQYNNIDWNKIDQNISCAQSVITIDSLKNVYTEILAKLDKAKSEIRTHSKTITSTLLPDQSVETMPKYRKQLQELLQQYKQIQRKVVRL